ncbi:hypothetical protein [Colwellia sp. 20A7]|uniref:hypothetical protein n=1 Tax=Colwellia sp. 20A7 TaxID=2689569 RepID=UPI00135B9EFF|nr:hypothetical protein [Colwellia sp. 20A7]
MSNKNKNDEEAQESITPIGELDQLRQIVFGDAQQQLITQLTTLRSDMEQALNEQDKKFSIRLDKMQIDISQQLENLEKQVNFVDKRHDDNEESMQKDHTSLASEYEMFTVATQQDFKDIEQSLNSESAVLSNGFNEQLEQLKNHLEAVSKELSSSKTDRKTLAKLLATMATNLADDQL